MYILILLALGLYSFENNVRAASVWNDADQSQMVEWIMPTRKSGACPKKIKVAVQERNGSVIIKTFLSEIAQDLETSNRGPNAGMRHKKRRAWTEEDKASTLGLVSGKLKAPFAACVGSAKGPSIADGLDIKFDRGQIDVTYRTPEGDVIDTSIDRGSPVFDHVARQSGD
jgi:hypothetical protein